VNDNTNVFSSTFDEAFKKAIETIEVNIKWTKKNFSKLKTFIIDWSRKNNT